MHFDRKSKVLKIIIILIILLGAIFLIIFKINDIQREVKLEGTDILSFNVTAIEDNVVSINKSLKKDFDSNCTIKKISELGNKKLVLFVREKDNWVGLQQFRKATLNRLQQEGSIISPSIYSVHEFKTEGQRYMWIGGINATKKISYMRVDLDGKDMKFDVSGEDYFINYIKLSDDWKVDKTGVHNNIQFYDANGKSIKDQLNNEFSKTK